MAHNKLRGRIVEKFGSISKFSDILGASRQTTNARVNGKVGFTRADIVKWCEALEILPEEVYSYFID